MKKDAGTLARASRDRFFALSLDLMCIASADGYFKRVSPSFTDILGWSEEEFRARPFISFVHPDDHAATLREVERQVVAGEKVLQFENRYQHKDGSWRVLSWRSVPHAGGLMYATARDVTSQRAAEVALRASEAEYRTLFESIDEGYCIIEVLFDAQDKPVDYRFLRINPAFEKQTGLIDAEGKRMRELAPQHEEHWFETYGFIAQTGAPLRFQNYAEQLHRWFDVYAFRYGEPANRQVAILFTNITERKVAEKKLAALNTELRSQAVALQAANQELDAFSYSVSHDLRAPLRGVSGFTRILKEDYAARLDAEGQRLLDVIAGEARRMGRLIDDLLEFARLGRRQKIATEVDMAALAGEVVGELQRAGAAPAATRVELGALPAAVGDPGMLRQVWVNLLGNALKFTGRAPQPVIKVGAESAEGMDTYFVQDNGAGFDEKFSAKLFGVFQRLHSEQEFEGTGVGLALVQRIIHRHGGKVWATGSVGHGATFFFSLPKTTTNPP